MENRAQTRFELSLTAYLPGSPSHRQTRISDLSEGGCYVDSIAEVIVGEVLPIRILVPSAEWLELEGAVAYVSQGLGFGLKFLNLDECRSRAIRLLIHRANPNLVQDSDPCSSVAEIDSSIDELMDSSLLLGNQEQNPFAITRTQSH
jgi:hypothetical protein